VVVVLVAVVVHTQMFLLMRQFCQAQKSKLELAAAAMEAQHKLSTQQTETLELLVVKQVFLLMQLRVEV
jgi:hypothetical protein